MPVASRSECLDLKCYIEWQIGYDLLATSANSKNTSLPHLKFSNYKQETKFAYELSEIIYYSHKLKLISEKDISDTYNKIKNVTDDNLIDVIDKMRIFRTSPIETTINDMMFFEMKVSYPLIVHKFGKYDIYTEVMNREKQRGVGVQPMLYVCIPITALNLSETRLIELWTLTNQAIGLLAKKRLGYLSSYLGCLGCLALNTDTMCWLS